jgi:Protein of unknown function (DUF1360)
MDPFRFFIFALAVWRVTHLIQAEDGPWDVIFKIRKWVGNGFAGSLMDCFYCLSIWVGMAFGVFAGRGIADIVCYSLALSGAAILIQRFFKTDS